MGCALSTPVGSAESGRAGAGAAASGNALPPPAADGACCYKPESEAARLRAVL